MPQEQTEAERKRSPSWGGMKGAMGQVVAPRSHLAAGIRGTFAWLRRPRKLARKPSPAQTASSIPIQTTSHPEADSAWDADAMSALTSARHTPAEAPARRRSPWLSRSSSQGPPWIGHEIVRVDLVGEGGMRACDVRHSRTPSVRVTEDRATDCPRRETPEHQDRCDHRHQQNPQRGRRACSRTCATRKWRRRGAASRAATSTSAHHSGIELVKSRATKYCASG